MNLIWKLLRQNINKPQLIGFAIANFIGLTIVLLACQFYFDAKPILSGRETLFKKDYFIVTKQLGLLSVLSSKNATFSKAEIEELRKTDFVKAVGAFTSSQFSVEAGLNYPEKGIQFSTDMFFESIPLNFIDVKTEDFRFSPSDDEVPIILPKNYLDLYNFGFAQSRSMPKISEELFQMVKFDITIRGNGASRQLKGRIVGFSNRINTILVPESFLTWANSNYGSGNISPSRLIVEIRDITNPSITRFFKDRGYEVANENMAASKISFFLKLIVSIVLFVGVLICVLSFFVLTLSIYLLLEKNMEKLVNLRLIGYSKLKITRPYELLTVGVNGITLLLSLLVVAIFKHAYINALTKVFGDFAFSGMWITILIGLLIFVALSFVNIYIIRRKVK